MPLKKAQVSQKEMHKNETELNLDVQLLVFTSAIADDMTSGIGSVVSPIPRLITFASGYFSK